MSSPNRIKPEEVSWIAPADLVAYLLSRGWEQISQSSNASYDRFQFAQDHQYQVIVPTNNDLADYALRVGELIEGIAAAEDRHVYSALRDVQAFSRTSESKKSHLKPLASEDDIVRRIADIKDLIPFPLYCTQLKSGEFEFVNKAFGTFLRYEIEDLENAESLYPIAVDRHAWVRMMRVSASMPTSFLTEYLVGQRDPDTGATTRHVIDTACLYGDVVIGILGESHEWDNWQLAENRVAAYRQILERVDTGVHEIDSEGRIVFMNRAERELLEADVDWIATRPHVASLSPTMHKAKMQRVDAKIKHGGRHLTQGSHRTFRKKPAEQADDSPDRQPEVVPVNIFDVAVPEPNHEVKNQANREIFTVVVDEHIPDDITRILRDFGPRNPLLKNVEEVEIATFIAVQRRFALKENDQIQKERISGKGLDQNELVFTFANSVFVDELVKLTRRYPEISVSSLGDVLGRTQSELWDFSRISKSTDFGNLFSKVDEKVMREEADDQRIEKHPSKKQGDTDETDVQVIKFPHYSRDDPDKVIGVRGFYWAVGGPDIKTRQELIREQLKTLYHPFEILNNIPVPVYLKDHKLRFIYGNRAYLDDLKKIQKTLLRPVASLDDIIGWTDEDLFPRERATAYEDDDGLIITGRKEIINQREKHGPSWVRVIKRPIKDRDKITGVQGIFWDEPTQGADNVRIDWRPEKPQLWVHDRSVEIGRTREWFLFEVLMQSLGKEVSYKAIERCGMVMPRIESRKDRGHLQQIKLGLTKELKAVHASLGGPYKFRITAPRAGHAYRMTLENEPT